MSKNMGTVDRAVRLLVVAVIAALYFMGKIGGTVAIVLEIIAVIFLVTSLVGWCPMYTLLHMSTKKPAAGPSNPA